MLSKDEFYLIDYALQTMRSNLDGYDVAAILGEGDGEGVKQAEYSEAWHKLSELLVKLRQISHDGAYEVKGEFRVDIPVKESDYYDCVAGGFKSREEAEKFADERYGSTSGWVYLVSGPFE